MLTSRNSDQENYRVKVVSAPSRSGSWRIRAGQRLLFRLVATGSDALPRVPVAKKSPFDLGGSRRAVPSWLRPRTPAERVPPSGHQPGSLNRAERTAIVNALHRTHGNEQHPANILSIGRTTLYRCIRDLNIPAALRSPMRGVRLGMIDGIEPDAPTRGCCTPSANRARRRPCRSRATTRSSRAPTPSQRLAAALGTHQLLATTRCGWTTSGHPRLDRPPDQASSIVTRSAPGRTAERASVSGSR
ncbi:helix-turn-helix domain-containing protein [Saccharopolyspora shandongensis]|uniref:helix-turn-helix domain-containing protein n=1 Tax=Saccharopolyspora shandongensis TaxID=418495 RepID=UPI00341A1E09